VTVSSDDRSPVAKAYHWSSRILVVSLEMVLPGAVGLWIDRRLGTMMLFTLVGLVVGCTGGVWHLIRMTSADTRRDQDQHNTPNGNNRGD
jgi:F0F1-type ATP synthase assembly protein I